MAEIKSGMIVARVLSLAERYDQRAEEEEALADELPEGSLGGSIALERAATFDRLAARAQDEEAAAQACDETPAAVCEPPNENPASVFVNQGAAEERTAIAACLRDAGHSALANYIEAGWHDGFKFMANFKE